ncbi:hypothetical protein [Pseudobacillus wudalianchiensis]|uniref:Uncharacterized protein n=1 Tax=Pseudobacillus wudalianchiensis TaxID=1743143 RepID=A0A1B9ATQ5_9BACI|nr:hypothetical protein [Bacillus wudalianchiensis]OCA87280.1 hypothetical protein A8F95_08510 [Bacillus wudalianchiensis]
MNRPYYLLGDTIRLKAEFKDWQGQPTIPADIKFIVYKSDWTKLKEIPLSQAIVIDGYTIACDYTAEQLGTFYVEAYGLLDGTPTIERKAIEIRRI